MKNAAITAAAAIRGAVTKFFVDSADYNGIPIHVLAMSTGLSLEAVVAALADLARTGDVMVVTASDFVNPHIKHWAISVERQLEGLAKADLKYACVYPSTDLVRGVADLSQYDDRPFTKRLASAEGQLEPVFFDLSVLEPYSADPRYKFTFTDYAGTIGLAYKFHGTTDVEPSDDSFLQTFGLGYDDRDERVVVVHLRYLHGLSPEHQQIWNAKLMKRPCKMVYEYFQNGILAEWAEDMSFYAAVLAEMRIINQIAAAAGRPPLFRATFEDEYPQEFSLFFRPTLRNFEGFVHVLDKMLSENIDKAFFQGDVLDEERTTRKDGTVEVRMRGTLAMLDEWLRKWKVSEPGFPANIMEPLREVRDLRQQPAHKIVPNEYDKQYAVKQDELVERVYGGLRLLRLVLQNWPAAKTVTVPEDLKRGRIKRF